MDKRIDVENAKEFWITEEQGTTKNDAIILQTDDVGTESNCAHLTF